MRSFKRGDSGFLGLNPAPNLETVPEEFGPDGLNGNNSEHRGICIVELLKNEGSQIGISISGGSDRGSPPRITSIRPGTVAYRSDVLAVGDHIISVNGIRTSNLKYEEIVNILRSAEDKVILEVAYEIPATLAETMCVCPRVIQVKLEKENGSFGFTLRGGPSEDSRCLPLTVTHVRAGGPADRENTIKAGDRLLSVDNVNLTTATLREAISVLKKVDREALFTVEYDVSIIDAVHNASGPLLVEIDKAPTEQLGITVTHIYRPEGAIVIESIKQASIAERCGALHVGDHILAVDDIQVDQMSAAEVTQLLKSCANDVIKLEIYPVSQLLKQRLFQANSRKGPSMSTTLKPSRFSPTSNYSVQSSLPSTSFPPLPQSRKMGRSLGARQTLESLPTSISSASLPATIPPAVTSSNQVCHTETTEAAFQADNRGFGFALHGPSFPGEFPVLPVVISSIDPLGPAERTGILQVGDRVLAANGQSTDGLTVKEVTQLVQQSHPSVVLQVEFDVAESVVPSSGTFAVKLPKRDSSLGISITAPKNRCTGDPLIISAIKKGSVAHRTGTLQPGDRLLAIDSIRMENCTVEDAAQILQECGDIVKLRIRKDDTYSEEPDDKGSVVYTVELVRHGGLLGITISGTEEPFDPIIISGLTEDGLAERTGAIHVGDRLLAINGQSLRGKPLSEAVLMLQNSRDVVTLKISKCAPKDSDKTVKENEPEQEEYLNTFARPLPSVDSAVESWDSSKLEMSPRIPRAQFQRERDNGGAFDSSFCPKIETYLDVPDETEEAARSICSEDAWRRDSTHSCRSDESCGIDSEIKDDISKEVQSVDSSSQSQLYSPQDRDMIERDSFVSSDHMIDVSPIVSSLQNKQFLSSKTFSHSDENIPDTNLRTGIYTKNYNCIDVQEQRCSTLPYTNRHNRENQRGSIDNSSSFTLYSQQGSYALPVPIEVHRVTLFKDQVYEDFGFSVSDGLFQRGVYVNRIRVGGPADLTGVLRPYDQILQVNETKTHDFDCCLAVPLIAAAGDRIELIISRPAYVCSPIHDVNSNRGYQPWVDDGDREDCSSPEPPARGREMVTKTL